MGQLSRNRIAFFGGLGLAGLGLGRVLAGRRGGPRWNGADDDTGARPARQHSWPDELVAARVRAAVARAASYPHAIGVSVDHGRVTLRGPVLERERGAVLRRVSRVAGVRAIDNRLEPRPSSKDIPSFGGPGHPDHSTLERDVWPPSWRAAAAGAGVALGGAGLLMASRRNGAAALALTATGAGLVARAVTNRPLSRLLRVGTRNRFIDLRKTVLIRAPVSEVFRFWAQVENFPLFMEHVLDVTVSPEDGRRSHWQVRGPAGMPVRWDAEVTRLLPDAMFAWKTLPGSQLEHAGAVHFEPLGPELTWLQVRMVYIPPAGTLGKLVAAILGGDPESRVEEDLSRLKSLLEDLHTLAPIGRSARDPGSPETARDPGSPETPDLGSEQRRRER